MKKKTVTFKDFFAKVEQDDTDVTTVVTIDNTGTNVDEVLVSQA
jgi:hypothetical protein